MPNSTPRELIWTHIGAIGTCMMVTRAQGWMRARPMRAIPRPEDNVIWFFTDREAHREADIRANPDACLTFADPKGSTFVSVSGRIAHVDDATTVQRLWSEGADVTSRSAPMTRGWRCFGSIRWKANTWILRPIPSCWRSSFLRRGSRASGPISAPTGVRGYADDDAFHSAAAGGGQAPAGP